MFVESHSQYHEAERKIIDNLLTGQVCICMNNFYIKVRISDGGTHLNKEVLPSEDALLCLNDGKIHIFNKNTLVDYVKGGFITLANTISKYSKSDNDNVRIIAEDAEDGEIFLDPCDGELAFCVTDTYTPVTGYEYTFITQMGDPYSSTAYYSLKEVDKITIYINEQGIHKTCVKK